MEQSNQAPVPLSGRNRKLLWSASFFVLLTGLGVLGWWWLRSPIWEEASFPVKEGGVCTACLSADEETLIIGGDDGVIRFWSLPDGRLLRTLPAQGLVRVALTRDGATLFTGGLDGIVKVWDLSTGKVTQQLVTGSRGIRGLALHPQETSLAFSCDDYTVRLWNFKEKQQATILTRVRSWAHSLSFSASGKFLAFDDNPVPLDVIPMIRVWSMNPLEEVLCVAPSPVEDIGPAGPESLLFLGETHILAVGTYLDTIELWDVEKKIKIQSGILRVRDGDTPQTHSPLACTPDGHILASGYAGGWLCLWNVEKRKKMTCPRVHTARIRSLCFFKDGKRLVSACDDIGYNDRGGHAEVKIWTIRR